MDLNLSLAQSTELVDRLVKLSQVFGEFDSGLLEFEKQASGQVRTPDLGVGGGVAAHYASLTARESRRCNLQV